MEDSVRRPLLEDVAQEAGLSPATVSLVLRGVPGPSAATRERVLAVATRLGYRRDRVASALASHRGRSVGIMMDVSNPFHAEMVEDAHEAADRAGYDLVLSAVTRSRNEARAIETLLDSRCAALLLLGPDSPGQALADLGRQLPVVVVGRQVRSGGVDVVRAADDEGVIQAVDHVAALGHRRIAYVDGGPGAIATLRRRGYRKGVRRHHVLGGVHIVTGGHTEADGARAARTLLGSTPMPTAVLVFNDQCALGLIDVLVRAGVDIPGQLSVVGYDDSPVAGLAHIDLTTVSQRPAELTEYAIAAVTERLEADRTEDREIVITPRLVVRGTTGPHSPETAEVRSSSRSS